MTLRVRLGKNPPTPSIFKPLSQPFYHGAGFLTQVPPCSSPALFKVLPTANVRQSPWVSSLKSLCCFSAMPLVLEIECKETESEAPTTSPESFGFNRAPPPGSLPCFLSSSPPWSPLDMDSKGSEVLEPCNSHPCPYRGPVLLRCFSLHNILCLLLFQMMMHG